MLSSLSLANQKILASYAAHKAAAEENHEHCFAALRAVYSLSIAEMMLAGDLSDLPTTEAK